MKTSTVEMLAVALILTVCAPAWAQKVITIDGQPLNIAAAQIDSGAKLAGPPSAGQRSGGSKALSEGDIRKLAETFGLMTETRTNPHLGFLDGDISYWAQQNLSVDRLKLEFGARRTVLEAADKQRIVIADQGKLSWAAQQIVADIQKARLALPQK